MRPLARSAVALSLLLAASCGGGRDRGGDDGGGGGGQGGGGGAGGAPPDGGGADKPRVGMCGVGGTVGFPPMDFRAPVEHCHWDEKLNVMSTPVVIDLTGDGKPEIVFPTYVPFDVKGVEAQVVAISGTDCTKLWGVPLGPIYQSGDLAAGDLDGDGKPEIVGVGIVMESSTSFRTSITVLDATGAVVDSAAVDASREEPAIANVDGEGPPEIVVGAAVYRLEGGKIKPVWQKSGGGGITSVADLDEDGVMELVATDAVYDGKTGAKKLDLPNKGYTAVVDFDRGSPGAEIVVVNTWERKVTVHAGLLAPEPGRVLFGPYLTDAWSGMGQAGGAPAVADFDGDGEPEIGVAAAATYTVFDGGCVGSPPPEGCVDDGVRWRSHVRDESSRRTTSTVFDFNCDGRAEVVYRDECWLRVYDGKTGEVRFAAPMTSNTEVETAVVADTDGSGHAKIAVGNNDTVAELNCPKGSVEEFTKTVHTGPSRGLYILEDPMDRWSPTRRVWNQNGYHVTNVDEDGHVPDEEALPWKSENTWRANAALIK